MAQGYFTLSEAAQMLAMSVDELKQMAQKGKIRSFQDRGTLRFRAQDIQELARTRGVSSDPELALGDASLPKSKAAPSSGSKKKPPAAGPKTPSKQQAAPEVFEFNFDDDSVDLGADVAPTPKSGTKSKPSSKGTKKAPSPVPAPGSDSDVRLVADGSDVTFSFNKEAAAKPPDSDVKIAADPLKPKTNIHSGAPGSKSRLAIDSGTQPKSKGSASSASRPPSSSAPQPPDSGVRLVPLDSDSDVKLLGASDEVALGGAGPSASSDSNVRLEKVSLPPADSNEGMMLTEEINLDEEIAKHQELDKNKPTTKYKPKSELKLPTSSPFELSDSDLELPAELKHSTGPKTPVKTEASHADSSDFDLAALPGASDDTSSEFDLGAVPEKDEGSSDFDLVPAADGSIVLEGDSNDFSLEASDEGDQVLQGEKGELTSSTSGISLANPGDAGISLEEKADDDSNDFDLSLEPEATPKPQLSQPAENEESSEFELQLEKTPKPKKKPALDDASDDIDLSLDVDAEADVPSMKDSDSEFEINLDASGEGKTGSESDSEFELTLDDSGNLAALEDEEAAPQVKSKKKGAPAADEQDIFDTDFEVPALDESDDATVADSELESSDFDIALDDSDLAAEDESGSQVVALDEEEDSETATDDEDGAVADDVEVEEESSDFSALDQDVEVDAEEGAEVEVDADEEEETSAPGKTRTVVKEKLLQPAPWGVMPIVFMLPCVIIMFLVGILGYELLQTSSGARPPGPLTAAIADMMNVPVSLKK